MLKCILILTLNTNKPLYKSPNYKGRQTMDEILALPLSSSVDWASYSASAILSIKTGTMKLIPSVLRSVKWEGGVKMAEE